MVGEVRGLGLMAGVELVKDRETKEPAAKEAHEAAQRAFRKGLLLLPCGESVVRFCPPLVVNARQVDTAASIFADVVRDLQKEVRSK